MNITGGELVSKSIRKLGIGEVFGLIGNQISPIMTTLETYEVRFIGAHHEQAAIEMADGWAQIKRKCGIAMVSGGPGFVNALSGIVKAFMAETPMIILVGNIVSKSREKGMLQDMAQLEMIKQNCKWCSTILSVERIPEYMIRAYRMANCGKKGPVILEIPIDILKQEAMSDDLFSSFDQDLDIVNGVTCNEETIHNIVMRLEEAKRPIILLGDETYYAWAEEALLTLTKCIEIPVFAINKARGMIPEGKGICFGSGRTIDGGIQLYAIQKADLILSIGVKADYQVDSFEKPLFNKNQTFIFVSGIENQNINLQFQKKMEVFCNVKIFVQSLSQYLMEKDRNICKRNWLEEISIQEKEFYKKLESKAYSEDKKVNPVNLILQLQKFINEDTIIVLDGSNAMFWAALLFRILKPGRLIIGPDSTYGSMGCGLALAIGAKIASPDYDVLLYTGDGSIGFNFMEIETAISQDISIKIVVHNDCAWGLCKTTQTILYGRTCGTDFKTINYDQIIKAFGGNGILVDNDLDIPNSIEQLFKADVITCLNAYVEKSSYSPGLECFNEILKKMK